MTWRKRTIMELARKSKMDIYGLGYSRDKFVFALEAFAELLREEAIAEANARANASWTLMCEKMVAIEREECAKVVEDYPYWLGLTAKAEISNAIRARSNHENSN